MSKESRRGIDALHVTLIWEYLYLISIQLEMLMHVFQCKTFISRKAFILQRYSRWPWCGQFFQKLEKDWFLDVMVSIALVLSL